MTSRELLVAADGLLTTASGPSRGRWPRVCAWLIRLALERALDDFWTKAQPCAIGCPMRAQLLLLPRYADDSIADQAREAWAGLARAGHLHLFDLAPTAGELRAWHVSVTEIVANLDARGTPAFP